MFSKRLKNEIEIAAVNEASVFEELKFYCMMYQFILILIMISLLPFYIANYFRENVESGKEPYGAAFAVYHRGEAVIDMWVGYADKEAERPWRNDTMTFLFRVQRA